MQLTLEQSFYFREALKRDLGHNPEVMPVMAAMLAVVTQHSPVVPGKDRMIVSGARSSTPTATAMP